MSKVKSILFDVDIKGKGIVNFDSNNQKYTLRNTNMDIPRIGGKVAENVNFSKKEFYGTGVYKKRNEEDYEVLGYKLKISSDCLKKAIYKEDIIATSPNLMHHDSILFNYLASPTAILKGWLFAKKDETLKRKSPIEIYDATQSCDAISTIETCSKAEYKEVKKNVGDAGSTTFYYKETVGDIEYKTGGFIDISQLSLISNDIMLDRYAFNPDDFEMFVDYFEGYFGDRDIELAYNKLKTSTIDLDEYSIRLKDKHIKRLINDFMIKLLGMRISRRNAFAETKTLRVKLVYDPILDRRDNEDGWITLKTKEDVENLLRDMNFHEFYETINNEDAIAKRAEFDKKKEELSEARKKTTTKK